ncbi:Anoctamin-1 [Dissostichus eleginoides]|uniref:Anoctamin n=1 Tax=Dissostichus eleginoides TaxID=100907 RepID=A0AAD9BS74_DISEL|nr:Anoctamin-1 [Dissostichus eleginoides]
MSERSSSHSVKLVSLAQSLSQLGFEAANGSPVSPPDDDEPPPPESGIELGPGLFFSDGKRKLTEEEKALMREEFEVGLMEAGLQLQRDKERAKGIGFIRLHIPWPILSREAELQKIKVAVKKKCELRKRMGVAGMWDSIMNKISTPFLPDVPDCEVQRDSQTRVHFKTLKHPFIRDKLHLYDIKSTETLFDNATRSRIVAEIISRTVCSRTCQTTGINSLLAQGVYDSAFPLHDGTFTRRGRRDQRNDRQLLHEEWANYGVMYKYQPVDLIRKYFGEQIGLYFAWLGVYTQLLIPPSVLGIIVFLYGLFTVDTNVPSQETCDDHHNITMCPLCDGVCDYWLLSSVCSLTRASYLFDNGVTVLFAIFMSLWAACFLEHWKRRQMCLKHMWDLTSLEDEEEELRPEYEEALLEKKAKVKELSKKKMAQIGDGIDGEKDQMLTSQLEPESLEIEDHLSGYLINVSTLLLLIFVTFSAVFGVVVYRICMLSVWSMNPDPEAKASVRMTVTTTGIILNMLVVLVLEEVYGSIAVWLTELELPKTKEEFEEKLIFKSFFLKSMNSFAPIFYVAFFKGRFAGRPGDYVYVFGDYRMEECAPPGCLIELCIQLSMIMLGKQLIQNNVFEVLIPKLKKMYRTIQEEKGKKRAAQDEDSVAEEKRPKQQFDKDFTLEPYEGVTPEYMEMIIQYGFVTLFVASFPLAPAFALLNNVIEIRLDAAKFVTEIRRPDAVRCKDIGIWYNILCGISKFSAFVISFTSEFVPRMVYQYMYSENGTMKGFTEHSLSYFNVTNFPPGSAPTSTLITGVSMCRYKDYRDPPWDSHAYTFSKQYWSVLAAKLAFVIFFQNFAMFLSMLVAWMIPDVPRSLREQLKKENMMLMEFLLNQDQGARAKSHSPEHSNSCYPAIEIVVEEPMGKLQEPQVEEDEEEERVENNLDELRSNSDSDLEVGRSSEEVEEKGKEEQGEKGEDKGVVEEVEEKEKEKDEEKKEEDEKGDTEQEVGEETVEGEENKEEEVKVEENKGDEVEVEENKGDEVEEFTVDLDAFMSQLGLLDDEPLPSTARETELPRSESKQEHQKEQMPPSHPSSKRGSSLSLSGSRAELTPSDIDTRPFSLIAPPPKEQVSRVKSKTLPSRQRESEACYSLPRPSHSTSLTRLQQAATSIPLVPLGSSLPASSNQLSPPHRPVSPSPPHPAESLSAQQPQAPIELFALKGPPPQQPRSRGKARCSTLPPRQRAPGPEESSIKPSQSTSFTNLGDRIPPSPSELKHNSPV